MGGGAQHSGPQWAAKGTSLSDGLGFYSRLAEGERGAEVIGFRC